jgi:hypothetical protein
MEIQSGAVAKSYTRKGFLIYEEMGKYFPIYKEAVSHIWGKFDFLFYQCVRGGRVRVIEGDEASDR